MNRTTRTIVVIGAATVTAGIASFGVYTAVKSIPVREVEVAHVYVAVAARNLPTGARLGEKDVKLVAWPSSSPVEKSFTKVESVVNRGLVSAVLENEPLTESKLAPLESGAGLPPTIPQGMRAMSVKVDEVIGVAGFVAPGTRVDLVVTLRQGGSSQEPMSRTIVSNVFVLTSGTRYDQEQAKDGKPHPSTVVTLAVSPRDAERIALASSEGRISLALRNPMDAQASEWQRS
jgi:pilus assembly protein CpaB